MKTKQKILHTAITMFNEHGFSRVSLRDIADQMKISPGNLTYHYRNRDDLLKAIYEQMFNEMEVFFGQEISDPMEILFGLPLQSRTFTYQYRFFFADLRAIIQEFPWLVDRHQAVVQKRMAGGQAILEGLIKIGHFIPPGSPDTYPYLLHILWMVPTFWYNQHPVLPKDHPAHQDGFLHETIFALIQPYLTPQGLNKWNQLNTGSNEAN